MRSAALFVVVAACSIPSYELRDDGGIVAGMDGGPDSGVGSSGSCTSWGDAGCVTALVAGYHRTCAIAGSNLYCWGYAAGTTNAFELSPEPIATNVDLVSSSANTVVDSTGKGVTCFTTAEQLECWGDGNDAQMRTNPSSNMPAPLTSPIPLKAIGVGADHVCVATDTNVSCWGATEYSQVGPDAMDVGTCDPDTCTDLPAQVYMDSSIDAVAAGLSHTCAHDTTGAVSCWGLDGDGQLGNHMMGSGAAQDAVYQTFNSTDSVVQISAGDITSCAVKRDGSWACWGAGGNGQLGNGFVTDSTGPVFAQPGMFSQISVGTSSTCGITMMGEVMCWGDNSTGVSGSNLTDPLEATPKSKGLFDATLIAVGYDHACAALANGTIECWGEAYEGALGTGPMTYGACPNLSSAVQCTATPVTVLRP